MEARYTLSFNGATPKDGHTMFTADVIKDLTLITHLEAENKQLKEDMKRYVPSVVIREGIDLRARNKQLAEDIAEKQSLFDLQHTRTLEADKLWQEETGHDCNCFPDLGELIRWLMEKAAGSLDKPASKE